MNQQTTRIESFQNEDGSFSHYSLVEFDEAGEMLDLTTCVMHDTYESAQQELEEILAAA